MNNHRDTTLKMRAGARLSLYTGEIEWDHADRMSTLHFYHAVPGDKIVLLDKNYQFAVATYAPEFDKKYIYTYDYQKEENWTTYRGDLRSDSYQQKEYIFKEDVYFRINIKRIDGNAIKVQESMRISEILRWVMAEEQEKAEKTYFVNEINQTVKSIKDKQTEDSLSLLLLSDTHYTVNGTWEDTNRNVQELSSKITYEGIVHLGDCTDGMVSREVTADYVKDTLQDLRKSNKQLYYVLGNHDSNYFRNNPDKFTESEMAEHYLSMQPQNVSRLKDKTYYYADFEKQQIRCIFLDSFDYGESVRYGFAEGELSWLEHVLRETPENLGVVVFSHVPPIPRLHFWSDQIRGSEKLMQLLKDFNKDRELIAYIHGHNHADQIDRQEGFPIISIGCGKCEYFTDKKPEGSITYERNLSTLSQELWDVLIISRKEKCLDLIRFGAGEDRHIELEGEIVLDSTKMGAQMKKVITYGTFDLFHEGHYRLLKRAKALGDYLIVGITTEHYDEERGKINVVDSLLERIENVRKVGFADEIIIEDHEGQKIEDIQKYGIDIFTVGSDWVGTFDYLNAFCKVVYLERTPDISSTMLRKSKFPIVRVGVVGTGRIAPRFIAEAKYVSGLNIRCAYNPHADSAQQFEKENEIECYTNSFEEFLEMVDAIYIAAPHETHYDYAKVALNHRKHVLCEKPLAFTKKQAVELFGLAMNKGVILMEGIKTAYCPGFTQMMNIAKNGKIGEIRDVEACFSRITDPHLREMTDAEFGGAFMEFGSYTLLPILKLLGLHYKQVRIDSILADNGVDLYTKIHFQYKNGLALSKTGVGVKSEGQLVIAGTKGYILAESPWWLTKKFEIRYENPNEIEKYTPRFWGDGLRYEISDFISKINGKGSNSTYKLTMEESIAMADIVECFLEKRREDRETLKRKNKNSGVKIWAHRGCSFEYPENTLPSFWAACKLPGLTGIELDIQMTKDGHLVVFHDETVDRITNGFGNVKDLTLQELKQLRFWNSGKNEVISDVMIPTIEEVLSLVKPYCIRDGIQINIELKNSKIRYEGMEERILNLINAYDMKDYIVYSSFNKDSLKHLKQLDQTVSTGILAYDVNECIAFGKKYEVDALHPNIVTVNKEGLVPAKTVVRAWNSKEPMYHNKGAISLFELEKLKKFGVTELFTNVPELYL